MSSQAAGFDRGLRHHLWHLYLAAGVVLLVAYYLLPALKGNGVLFNAIGLSSAAAIIAGVRLHHPTSSRAWYAFALGHLLFVVGDLFYYSFASIFDVEIPFPSIGDLFYLSVYPAFITGLLILIRTRNPRSDMGGLIDALIVTTGLALVSWIFLMAPYAHQGGSSLLQKIVSIAYPMMDVLMLAVAVRLSVDNGMRRPALYLLVSSIVSLLATDAIFGLLTLQGGYQEGGLLDIGWATYYLLWGAAALHPSMRTLEEPAPYREARLSPSRLALLLCASMITPLIRAIHVVREAPLDQQIMLIGSVILHGLVIIRMAGLVRDRERSIRREKALQEAGKALVAAASREDVYAAALKSILSLVGSGNEARLCLYSDSRELVVAATSGTAMMTRKKWVLPADALRALGGLESRDTTLDARIADTRLQAALRLPRATDHCVAFPLFAREELRGLIFVIGSSDFPAQVKDALQTLGTKVALALESAALTEDLHRRQNEARFRSLVQNSSDLITVIDAGGTITYQSPSVEKVLGYHSNQLISASLAEFLHPQETNHVLKVLTAADRNHGDNEAIVCRLRHCDGSWRFFEILHTDLLDDATVAGIVLNARDVSERKAFEEQLTHQALHDSLTNLANRALFKDRVEHAVAACERRASGIAVIFIDLDDFKTINDSLGHMAGDEVLQKVAVRLEQYIRPMDTLARLGGDEFALLFEDVQRFQDVADVANRILTALRTPISIGADEVVVNASIGMATFEDCDSFFGGADELMRNADLAMYMAKREGKGSFRLFEPAMHASVVDRLQLKGDLQRAIESGEIELHYQPIVDLETQEVVSLEALARWHHPDRGAISPVQFVPLAEETGLIVPLGRWVLRTACQQGRGFQETLSDDRLLSISVNLSVRQLQDPALVDHVLEALEESGLRPDCLTLEITESVLMIDVKETIGKLEQLKGLGIRLAVDDFGTGYSSLSYLSQFPVDMLKIDRAFVRPVAGGVENSALVHAIVRLAEALHLDTVAEGIEDQDQLRQLSKLGCRTGQGFLFAAPMDLSSMRDFLEQGKGRASYVGESDESRHSPTSIRSK